MSDEKQPNTSSSVLSVKEANGVEIVVTNNQEMKHVKYSVLEECREFRAPLGVISYDTENERDGGREKTTGGCQPLMEEGARGMRSDIVRVCMYVGCMAVVCGAVTDGIIFAECATCIIHARTRVKRRRKME